jgi:hypothetical protein
MFYVSICVIKISFSLGARMLFLAPNGCKGSYFLRYLSIKKEKSEKKFGVFKKYMYLCSRK